MSKQRAFVRAKALGLSITEDNNAFGLEAPQGIILAMVFTNWSTMSALESKTLGLDEPSGRKCCKTSARKDSNDAPISANGGPNESR